MTTYVYDDIFDYSKFPTTYAEFMQGAFAVKKALASAQATAQESKNKTKAFAGDGSVEVDFELFMHCRQIIPLKGGYFKHCWHLVDEIAPSAAFAQLKEGGSALVDAIHNRTNVYHTLVAALNGDLGVFMFAHQSTTDYFVEPEHQPGSPEAIAYAQKAFERTLAVLKDPALPSTCSGATFVAIRDGTLAGYGVEGYSLIGAFVPLGQFLETVPPVTTEYYEETCFPEQVMMKINHLLQKQPRISSLNNL